MLLLYSTRLLIPTACLAVATFGPGPVPVKPLSKETIPTSRTPDLYLARPNLHIERTSTNRVSLRWNAIPETTTQGYRVERSADNYRWTLLAYIPMLASHRYHYEDTSRSSVYYRVARLDLSRRYTLSQPVLSPVAEPYSRLAAQPNPAHGEVRLVGCDPSQIVEVLDAKGQLVNQISEPVFSTTAWRPGIYALRQGRQITRLIVR